MYRPSLLGLFALVLCSTSARAQMASVNTPPSAYVLSEQVTCTCGAVLENYVGGPRHCSQCGEALPEPPLAMPENVTSVDQVDYQQEYAPESEFVDMAYSEPMYTEYEMGPCCDSSCGQMGPLTIGHAGSIFRSLFSGACSKGCRPCLAPQLRNAPTMLGGGFGGSGMIPFQGSETVSTTIFAIGNVVNNNGVNSAIQYDSTLTPITNPDFASVGVGWQTAGTGTYNFNVVESVPGANVGLPAGLTFVSAIASETESLGTITNAETWQIAINGFRSFTVMIPDAANAGAAVVGRTRVSGNNSPMPRTRAFFTYDRLSGASLNAAGVDVNRFIPGMEFAMGKNKNSSFEFRIPCAVTMSSNILLAGGTSTNDTQMGDIFMSYKHVLKQSNDYLISGGIAVTLPSADDLSLVLSDGTTAMAVENRSVHLMPYMATMALWTDRLFTQSFIQVDVDATGNDVYFNDGTGLNRQGRLRDTTRLYTDTGLGYYLRRPGDNQGDWIQSIAGLYEIHYEQQLQRNDVLSTNGFTLGSRPDGYRSTLTMSAGAAFQFQGGAALNIGYAFPVGNEADQTTDGQLRVILNRYF